MAFVISEPRWDSNFRQNMAMICIKKLRSGKTSFRSLLGKLRFPPFNVNVSGLNPWSSAFDHRKKMVDLSTGSGEAGRRDKLVDPAAPSAISTYEKNRWLILRGPAKPAVDARWWISLRSTMMPTVITSLWMLLRRLAYPDVEIDRWVLLWVPAKPAIDTTWRNIISCSAKLAVETSWWILLQRLVVRSLWILMWRPMYPSVIQLGMKLTRVSGSFDRLLMDWVEDDGWWSSCQRPMDVLGVVDLCFKRMSNRSLVALLECCALHLFSPLRICYGFKSWWQSFSVAYCCICYFVSFFFSISY